MLAGSGRWQSMPITDLVNRYDMIMFVRQISSMLRYDNFVWENIISDITRSISKVSKPFVFEVFVK